MKITDPHLHFIALNQGDYRWLKASNPPFWPQKSRIYRDFDEHDISLNNGLVLAAYVHIEAGFDNQQGWREVEYWQGKANMNMRSVQTCDLTESPVLFAQKIQKGLENSSLVGVRHIIDDPSVLSHQNCLSNLRLLMRIGLLFELQIDVKNSNLLTKCVDLLSILPNLKVVLNHAGFVAESKSRAFAQWRDNFRLLQEHPYFSAKVSGLEMRQETVSLDDLLFQLDACLSLLPEHNLMLASNFPLLTMANTYQQYWELCIKACEYLGVSSLQLASQSAQNLYFEQQLDARALSEFG